MHAVQTGSYDERAESRHAVKTLLVARLHRRDRSAHLCRIRNLSETGMMIETPAPITVSETLTVELRGEMFSGEVMWAEDNCAGVRLTETIEVGRVLGEARLAAVRTDRPRAPRFKVDSPARISSYGRTIDVILEDVSQSGARLRLPRPPRPETEVILSIPGLPSRRCTTRWSNEEWAGVVFHDIIPYPELAAWIESASAQG